MIPGITTRVRYMRLGKIRLGEKAVSARGAKYPKATDHFVFVDAAAIAAVYSPNGEPCTMIAPVLLPGNPKRMDGGGWDFSDYWKTSRSAYGASAGLFCRCSDGVTATRVNRGLLEKPGDPKNGKPIDPMGAAYIQENNLEVAVGEMFELPCPADECPYWEQKYCKNLGVLDMMLPQVAGFGVWTIQTSSFHSIRNIESSLQMIAATTGGVLAGIPLGLRLVPQQAQVEGKGKTIFVLELLCPHNLQQLAGLKRKSLASGGSILATIEGEVAPDEFYAAGGAELDARLAVEDKRAVTQGATGPVSHVATTSTHIQVDHARKMGGDLGLSKAQIEAEIRKAGPDHLDDLIGAWEALIAERGGEAQDAPGDGDEPLNDPADIMPDGPAPEPAQPAPEWRADQPPPPLTPAQRAAAQKADKVRRPSPATTRAAAVQEAQPTPRKGAFDF